MDVSPLLIVVLSVVVCASVWKVLSYGNKKQGGLPPGPSGLPIVGNIFDMGDDGSAFERIICIWKEKYGGIFTVWLGRTPWIIVTDRHWAHQCLIKQDSLFAGRPKPAGLQKMFSSDGHSVSSSDHGSLWRALRRNLVSVTLSNSAIALAGSAREQSIEILCRGLEEEAQRNHGVVQPREHLKDTLYRSVFYMCFGFTSEKDMSSLKLAMTEMLYSLLPFDNSPITALIPRQKKRAVQLRRAVQCVMLPLIRAANSPSYVSSLRDLRIHEEHRPLTDDEMVTLCVEFIMEGTETTATTIEWCLANLVTDQRVQESLLNEIVTQKKSVLISEEETKEMRYLQAVVKETLRRYPPAHFSVNHAVHQDVVIDKYRIPAGSQVIFYLHGMGMDPSVWERPEEFRPERFLEERAEADMVAGKDILFMPFGAGRRMCPGMRLAILHASLVVTRLVQRFKWEVVPGEKHVDMSDVPVFAFMMRQPLRSLITLRNS